jgi:hypothetical protein
VSGFSLDGEFNTLTEPDFFVPFFYAVLLFGFYPAKERKTGRVISLKNCVISVPSFSQVEGGGQMVNVGDTERRPPLFPEGKAEVTK